MDLTSSKFRRLLLANKSVGLDSMCFIYQFAGHGEYGRLTEVIFELLETGKIRAVTSTVSVIETLVWPEKRQEALIVNEYEKVFRNLPNLTIAAVDWAIARIAAKLRAKYAGLRTPDAIQLAPALLKGYPLFITNDKNLKQVKEIEVRLLGEFI